MNDDSSEILLAFGRNLEQIKKNKKMSYRQIAAKCDLEHSDIKRYVDGKINPTLLSLVQLSRALDISISELVSFDELELEN